MVAFICGRISMKIAARREGVRQMEECLCDCEDRTEEDIVQEVLRLKVSQKRLRLKLEDAIRLAAPNKKRRLVETQIIDTVVKSLNTDTISTEATKKKLVDLIERHNNT